MRKLDAQHIKNNVVKKLAVGETQTSIAEQIGVDQSTISKFTSKDDVRTLIEDEQLKLAEVTPDAVQNVKDLVEEMKDIPKDNIKSRELSYKASKDVLKATNIFPSPQFAHNIYNDNRIQTQNNISPSIIKLIGNAAIEKLKQVVIGVEDEENSDIEKW